MKLTFLDYVRQSLRRLRTGLAGRSRVNGAPALSAVPAAERRVDSTTATKIELARIYCDVFGPAATARNMASAGLNPSTLHRVLKREHRRRMAFRQSEPAPPLSKRWQAEERRDMKR